MRTEREIKDEIATVTADGCFGLASGDVALRAMLAALMWVAYPDEKLPDELREGPAAWLLRMF